MITVAVTPGSVEINTVRVCWGDRNTVIVVLDCKTKRPQLGFHDGEGCDFSFGLEAPTVEPMKKCCRLQHKRPDVILRHNFCPECGGDLRENKFDPPAPGPATEITLSNLPGTDWEPLWDVGRYYIRLVLVRSSMFTSEGSDGQPEEWTAEGGPVLGDWVEQTEEFEDEDGYVYEPDLSMVLIREGQVVAHVAVGSGPYDRAHVFGPGMALRYAAELSEEDGYVSGDVFLVNARRWCEESLRDKFFPGEEKEAPNAQN